MIIFSFCYPWSQALISPFTLCSLPKQSCPQLDCSINVATLTTHTFIFPTQMSLQTHIVNYLLSKPLGHIWGTSNSASLRWHSQCAFLYLASSAALQHQKNTNCESQKQEPFLTHIPRNSLLFTHIFSTTITSSMNWNVLALIWESLLTALTPPNHSPSIYTLRPSNLWKPVVKSTL